jgi:hypothetical protein
MPLALFITALLLALAGCDVITGANRFVDQPSATSGKSSAVGAGGSTGAGGVGGTGSMGSMASSSATAGASKSCGPLAGPCKVVFVTDASFEPDFGTLDQADAACAKEAPGAKAWLSDSGEDAVHRIPDTKGGYCLKDGTLVAACKAQLVEGPLLAPIDTSFSGVRNEESLVWTGTKAGKRDLHCGDWKSKNADTLATVGHTGSKSQSWSNSTQLECSGNSMARLYCFLP